MLAISFGELGTGKNVPITSDGLIFATELAMVITGKNRNDANQTLRNLKDEHFRNEKFVLRSFKGKGNGRVKLVTLDHAIELIMVLPGKVAKEYRTQMVDIIKRYLAGDKSLIIEIEANAASTATVNTIARMSQENINEEAFITDKFSEQSIQDEPEYYDETLSEYGHETASIDSESSLFGKKREREEYSEQVIAAFDKETRMNVHKAVTDLREFIRLLREKSSIEEINWKRSLEHSELNWKRSLEYEEAKLEVKRKDRKLDIDHQIRLMEIEDERAARMAKNASIIKEANAIFTQAFNPPNPHMNI